MALKKRSKVSAEFSMSSLTDIIFLLLIFFMLTSNLINPNALNLKMPGKSKTTSVSNSKITDVTIKSNGRFYLNRKKVGASRLEAALKRLAKKESKPTITISPEPNAPIEKVAAVMDIAMRYHISAIMSAELNN
ncbi:MAG TPA: biopolymer transporter ExbD [Saprospiraceae bacterium]|nr:biopolymer transporter ExbD [Saprospiraceae bacterium]